MAPPNDPLPTGGPVTHVQLPVTPSGCFLTQSHLHAVEGLAGSVTSLTGSLVDYHFPVCEMAVEKSLDALYSPLAKERREQH